MNAVHPSDTSSPSSPRPRRRLVIGALAAAAALGASAITVSSAGADPAPPEAAQEWQLTWSDEFDGAAGAQPSTEDWQYDLGHGYEGGPDNWGTGEIAAHTDDPANVAYDGDGHLQITALRDDAGAWTSARIETVRSDFRPAEGGALRVEGSLQLPQVTGDAALGYWPAFWALGSPYRGNYQNWPSVGEFDFLENVNGLDWAFGTLHCGTAPGGPCNENNGIAGETTCGGSCHEGFHTYAFEWDETGETAELRWYVDDEQYHSVSEADLDAETWTNLADHAGYMILLNLAIGGAFPDGVAGQVTPTAATEPGHSMLVDYVRVYNR